LQPLEGIADFTKRPLYTISSGELGTNPATMEENLSAALELATTRCAILLIDEADIFLEQRSAQDLERNGLVSSTTHDTLLLSWSLLTANMVFLRLLEYYEGILFLTTNRVGAFDRAFKSRIHLAIKYHALSPASRAELWEFFINKTYPESHFEWLDDECRDSLGGMKLNGREIKNACRTAHALAVSSGETLRRSHIDIAVKEIRAFKADLKEYTEHSNSSDSDGPPRRLPTKRRRIT
jgi:AAA+ superfamily predicted ATPase